MFQIVIFFGQQFWWGNGGVDIMPIIHLRLSSVIWAFTTVSVVENRKYFEIIRSRMQLFCHGHYSRPLLDSVLELQ